MLFIHSYVQNNFLLKKICVCRCCFGLSNLLLEREDSYTLHPRMPAERQSNVTDSNPSKKATAAKSASTPTSEKNRSLTPTFRHRLREANASSASSAYPAPQHSKGRQRPERFCKSIVQQLCDRTLVSHQGLSCRHAWPEPTEQGSHLGPSASSETHEKFELFHSTSS